MTNGHQTVAPHLRNAYPFDVKIVLYLLWHVLPMRERSGANSI